MDRPHWYSDDSDNDRASSLNVTPFQTWSGNSQLMLVMVVTMVLQLLIEGFQGWFELRPASLFNPLNWYRFVSYAFLHGGPMHLGMNLLMLYFFGSAMEQIAGGRRSYFAFCALSAAVAALAYAVGVLVGGVPLPMIGASGICYAVLMGVATYDPQQEIQLLFPPVRMKMWALAAILMTMALLYHLSGSDPGTAHIAHLGGGLFGYGYIKYRSRFRRLASDVQAKRDVHQQQKAVDKKKEIDRILEKISVSGISSLSRAERRFMDSVSKEMRDSH